MVSRVSPDPGRRRSCEARMPSRPSPTSASEGGSSTPRPAASPTQRPPLRSGTLLRVPVSVPGSRTRAQIRASGERVSATPSRLWDGRPSLTRGAQVSPSLCEGCAAPAREGSSKATCCPPHPGLPCAQGAGRRLPAAPPERRQAQPQYPALGQNERLEGSRAERETTYLKTNKQQTKVYQSVLFSVAQCTVAPLCYVVSWKAIFTCIVTHPVDSPTLRAPSVSQKDPEYTVPLPTIRGSRTRTSRAAPARCHQVACAAVSVSS